MYGSKQRRVAAALVVVGCVAGWTHASSAAPQLPVEPPPAGPLDDPERDCLEAVPEAASLTGVTDTGQKVTLDVLVLLDGLTLARGQKVVNTMAESYAPLDVELVASFKKVKLAHDGIETIHPDRGPEETGDAVRLMEQAKEMFGGARPAGTDVVLILTAKDIFDMDGERHYTLAGMADCIGGVRYPEHAFAISEGATPYEETLNDELLSGKIAAHEVGHLMGAHHHYANCGQGDQHPEGSDSYCTVMFPLFIRYMARNFGTLEGAVVRGHSVEFASP